MESLNRWVAEFFSEKTKDLRNGLDEKQEKKWRTYILALSDYVVLLAFFLLGCIIMFYNSQVSEDNGFTWQGIMGYIIMGAPVFLSIFRSGFIKGFLSESRYEVITTYSDGTKSSDGGAQSAMANIGVLFIIKIPFILFLGGALTAIKFVWLTLKTIGFWIVIKNKPKFLITPFSVLIIWFVAFLSSLIIISSIGNAKQNAEKEAYEKHSEKIANIVKEASPQNLITVVANKEAKYYNGSIHVYQLEDSTNTMKHRVYTSKNGEVRVKGAAIYRGEYNSSRDSTYWLPIEFGNCKKCFIEAGDVSVKENSTQQNSSTKK